MKSFVLLALAAVAYGQQCGYEFEQFRQCVQVEDGTTPPTPKPYPGGSVSEDVTNCFLTSGCQQPELIGHQAAGHEALMGTLIKCSDETKDRLKPMIQQCMDGTQNVGTGFVLHPDLIAPLPLTMPNPPPAPPAVVILHSISQIYNDHICPGKGAKDATKNCVIRVYNKFIPTPTNTKSPVVAAAELTRHCYNQEVCKTRMTETCRGDIENLRAYLCNCAKSAFAEQANMNTIIDTFKSCVTRESGHSTLQHPAITTFEQYAQRLVTNLMCLKAPDPCKPPEQPQQPGQQGQQGQQQQQQQQFQQG